MEHWYLKQSDNILYACFVCSSLLRLGKSDGALVRFANKTAQVKKTGLSYVGNPLEMWRPKKGKSVGALPST